MAPPRRPSRCFQICCFGVVVLLSFAVAPSRGVSQNSRAISFETVDYSVATLDNDYKSSSKFDPRGMGNLYNVTKMFIKAVQPGDPYPDGLLVVDDGNLDFGTPEWHTLLQHYAGLVACVLVGLVVALVLPVAGLLFCCCRCTGRCGARSQPFDRRHDPCARHFFGILMTVFAIAVLFGVVCAFVTNEYMEQGVRNFPDKASNVVSDARLFIKNTKKEVNSLLRTNYKELVEALYNILTSFGSVLKVELARMSNATALDDLEQIVKGLGYVKYDLLEIEKLTNVLQTSAEVIQTGLEKVKSDLQDTLDDCNSILSCSNQLNITLQESNLSIGDLKNQFQSLPNVSASLQSISGLMTNNLQQLVKDGTDKLNDIQAEIQSQVDSIKPTINTTLENTGDAITGIAGEITGVLEQADQFITQNTEEPLTQMKNYIQEYSHYRYQVGLAVSCILLMILAPITFGLFCGFCGKRPDAAYVDDSCTKGTGARLLMIAVWFIFLTGSIMMVVVVALMVVGVFGERAVCETFRNPEDNQLFAVVDQLVPLDKIFQVHVLDTERRRLRYRRGQPDYTNVSSVIAACHQNLSIYSVLHLESRINVSEVLNFPDKYGFKEILDEIQQQLKYQYNITLIDTAGREQLNDLADSSISDFDFTYYEQFSDYKPPSFTDFIETLTRAANRVTQSSVKIRLKLHARDLMHYQRDIDELNVFVSNLSTNVNNLKDHLKVNHSSLKDAVNNMISELNNAEVFLNNEGHTVLPELANNYSDLILSQVTGYMTRVVNLTKTEVGKCWPLSQAYDAVLTASCDEILNPFNGFWASVGWCVLLFIGTLFIAVKLSALYQKSDPWPGSLVEAEYMYDAYADRDNIPLANVNDKKRKKTKQSRGRSYQETYDNANSGAAGGYMGDYSAHLGRGERDRPRSEPERVERASQPQGAPKHWDFPNNGPPRYHAPRSPPLSTEYERPPPYYFPGPGENRS